ncbi:MAG: hypothetical protein V1495_04610 [Pseudomonadota bacterium]
MRSNLRVPHEPSTWKPTVAIWLFAFLLLLLTSGRMPIWGDAQLTSYAAQGLIAHGTPDVPPQARIDVLAGTDGRFYTKYSWVPILLSVPPAAVLPSLGSVETPALRLLFVNSWIDGSIESVLASFLLAVTTVLAAGWLIRMIRRSPHRS